MDVKSLILDEAEGGHWRIPVPKFALDEEVIVNLVFNCRFLDCTFTTVRFDEAEELLLNPKRPVHADDDRAA